MISSVVRKGFAASGYSLATKQPARGRAILEVYPHTALLSLLRANVRIPYKVSKSGSYWGNITANARRRRLLEQWRTILTALRAHIAVDLSLPSTFSSFSAMKRYEDAIDAMVCAWVAIEFLAGNLRPLGDRNAAIWTPR
jgi:predicted RNase H-like nuclease